MAAESIGCSLAEAAESAPYTHYLEEAAAQPHPGLHVVYINTSLRTKALSHALVPTITCTSSKRGPNSPTGDVPRRASDLRMPYIDYLTWMLMVNLQSLYVS